MGSPCARVTLVLACRSNFHSQQCHSYPCNSMNIAGLCVNMSWDKYILDACCLLYARNQLPELESLNERRERALIFGHRRMRNKCKIWIQHGLILLGYFDGDVARQQRASCVWHQYSHHHRLPNDTFIPRGLLPGNVKPIFLKLIPAYLVVFT